MFIHRFLAIQYERENICSAQVSASQRPVSNLENSFDFLMTHLLLKKQMSHAFITAVIQHH